MKAELLMTVAANTSLMKLPVYFCKERMHNIRHHYEKNHKLIGKMKYADLKLLWSVNKRTVRNESHNELLCQLCGSKCNWKRLVGGRKVGGHIQILNLEAPVVSCNLRGVCREDVTALASLLKPVQDI
jgi:hypothetical protein